MNLKVLARAQLSVFKNGLLLAFVLTLVYYLLNWIWGFVLSTGHNPFQIALVNFIFKIGSFLAIAYLIGLAFETKLFKKLVLGFLGRLPLIGVLVQSLHHFERIKREGTPEVEFELTPGSGVWIKGWVSNEWEHKRTGKIVCGVVLPMFVHPIGGYVCVEKDKLFYTGRQALENIADCLSGGLIGRK